MVSKARTGTSRALGTDAGYDKGAQGGGPGLGCWWRTAREARRGGGGGGGGGVNRIGMKMNGSPLSLFIKQLDK